MYLRLVKDTSTVRPALRTLGWNATEILVEDPPALERRLADSKFRVIGPPAPLDMNPAVVAMQALGPAGELFYFTRIPPGKSKFNLGSAQSFVDRVFIVVLGVHDIRRTLDFYSQTFGLPVTEPAPSRVAVLAQAWGMPADQAFPLAIVRLPERFLIEVDEYPAASEPRVARRDGTSRRHGHGQLHCPLARAFRVAAARFAAQARRRALRGPPCRRHARTQRRTA